MEEIKSKVIKILDKYIFDKKIWETAPENFRMIEDLKINSARIVDIVIDIEEMFDIEIDNKTLQNLKTINDIVSIVIAKQGK
jgi:acyl carrier protein